jgi:thiol-disulfide isomerase/thioredoxin
MEKNQCIILFLTLLFSFSIQAQDSIVISGEFKQNNQFVKVVMHKFNIGYFPIAATSIKENKFRISLPPLFESGVYRFKYSFANNDRFFDLIINGKDKNINLVIDANSNDLLEIFGSDENKMWYEYNKNLNYQIQRIVILQQFINSYYFNNSRTIKQALLELNSEEKKYRKQFNSFLKKMNNTWAFVMVKNKPFYFINPKDDLRIQDFLKKEYFWDNIDTTNPNFINSPLYTDLILNYLRYWLNPNMNFSNDEKTEGLKKSADVVMNVFSKNDSTSQFALKYLQLGFKEIGEEEVLKYLDTKYSIFVNSCFDDNEKTEYDKRIKSYALLSEGNIAPDFPLTLSNNKSIKGFHDFLSQETYLLFWSISCPHCIDLLPKVNRWASKHLDKKVLAISLESNNDFNTEFIKSNEYIIFYKDGNGWNTPAAVVYNIMATPSLFIIDSNKKIKKKYNQFDQLFLD